MGEKWIGGTCDRCGSEVLVEGPEKPEASSFRWACMNPRCRNSKEDTVPFEKVPGWVDVED